MVGGRLETLLVVRVVLVRLVVSGRRRHPLREQEEVWERRRGREVHELRGYGCGR
jgi:hypothetical protein